MNFYLIKRLFGEEIMTMKTLFILFFTLITVVVSAQTTTEEEFNYVTNGYKIAYAQGADIKKGYTLKDAGEWTLEFSNGNVTMQFKFMYRDNDTKPCAIMVIYKGDMVKQSDWEYYCLPSEDASDLWGKTMKQIGKHYYSVGANKVYESMMFGYMHLANQLATK